MNPASVVILTVLIGAGQGCSSRSTAASWPGFGATPQERDTLGPARRWRFAFTGLGLLASFFHLGTPSAPGAPRRCGAPRGCRAR